MQGLDKGNFEKSASIPFVTVKTDGARRKHHAAALLYVAKLLIKGGSDKLNMHHAVDACLDKNLPLTIGNKWYDIALKGENGLIILLEVKIIKGKKP